MGNLRGARSLVVLLLALAGCAVSTLGPAPTGGAPADKAAFDLAAVTRGAQLALIGNCNTCHTAPGGKPYAGGLALATPFGTLYSTNITPDPNTGIGAWSKGEFLRAVKTGTDRQGRHYYPAFPYDHFALLNPQDVEALFAFLMTRNPVQARAPANQLLFPVNIRITLAGWKLLFFDASGFQPNASRSAQWNRGAYLVEGLAHCGACHTPRNWLGAENKASAFAGGDAEGWHAPALNAQSPARLPWTADRLFRYLRSGSDDVHGPATGPMAAIVSNLSMAAEEDVRAIAVYVASLDAARMPEPRGLAEETVAHARENLERLLNGGDEAIKNGAAIYAGACAACHEAGRQAQAGALHLALGSSVALPGPRNLLQIIWQGILPAEGEAGPWMPGFAGALTEKQLGELLMYLRMRFGDRPAWNDLQSEIRTVTQAKERQ